MYHNSKLAEVERVDFKVVYIGCNQLKLIKKGKSNRTEEMT